ncbi:hypothetical protein TUM18999_35190 [Pseudomonas tohonis]|uniref:Uncharacterized protein n=1 Tax=Pseudomonas tohonis TaxID=2725477 RepID=A0A6J4E7C8_9PSED|nr:hypothetical protein TUM18999_35190 [Pseudomonas tohonis]GJN54842.1 hypothetical protein TUM20286_45940 [Pseudomonas tohonis]
MGTSIRRADAQGGRLKGVVIMDSGHEWTLAARGLRKRDRVVVVGGWVKPRGQLRSQGMSRAR